METTQQVFIVRADISSYSAALAAGSAIATIATIATITATAAAIAAIGTITATATATPATGAAATTATTIATDHIDLIIAVVGTEEDANMPTKIEAGPLLDWFDEYVCRSRWRARHSRYRQSKQRCPPFQMFSHRPPESQTSGLPATRRLTARIFLQFSDSY